MPNARIVEDSESDIEDVYDETTNFIASKHPIGVSGNGTKEEVEVGSRAYMNVGRSVMMKTHMMIMNVYT